MAFKGPFRLGTDSYDGAEWVSDSLGQTVYTAQCPDLLNTLTAERDALKAERDRWKQFVVDWRTSYLAGEHTMREGEQPCQCSRCEFSRRAISMLTEEPKR